MTVPHYTYRPFDGGAEAWDSLIGDCPNLSLLQTWAYGAAKETATAGWLAERGVLEANGIPRGAVQTMIRTLPFLDRGMAWVNRGPLLLSHADESHLATMVRVLAVHFTDTRGYYLRIAPAALQGADLSTSDLQPTTTPGWASAVIDLRAEEEALRGAFHGKWRNALVRAERADVTVRCGDGGEVFSAFMGGHRDHLAALGTTGGLDVNFMTALQDELPAARKLLCFTAWSGADYLGGAAIARYGTTGEYLAGHNTDLGRAENAGQLLLWSVLLRLKQDGYLRFDLGGMDERLTPSGIYRFKNRMGGTPYRLAGELEGGADRLINNLIRWRVEHQRRSMGEAGA